MKDSGRGDSRFIKYFLTSLFIRFLWNKNSRLQTGLFKQLWGGDMSKIPMTPFPPCFQQLPDPAARCEFFWQFLRRHRGTGRWQCGTGCVSATYRARWARCTAHVAAKSRWAHHIVGEAGGKNLVKHSFPKFNGWNPFEIDDAFQEPASPMFETAAVIFRYSWSDQGKVGIAGVQLILLREATWRTEMPWWVYSTGLDDLRFPTEFSKQMGNLLVGFEHQQVDHFLENFYFYCFTIMGDRHKPNTDGFLFPNIRTPC